MIHEGTNTISTASTVTGKDGWRKSSRSSLKWSVGALSGGSQ
jgi:hypothetical protein